MTFLRSLYGQVLTAILIGVALGHLAPETAIAMKPFGDGFIKLIKMLVAPIIFCTVVTGFASMGNMREAGRIGVKSLLYFFIASAVTLVIGMIVANVFEPGVGMNIHPKSLDAKAVHDFIGGAPKEPGLVEFIMHIIPSTAVDAFAEGEILQVLFFSLLFAGSLTALGEKTRGLVKLIDEMSHVLFTIIGFIVKLAPIGAFGAMAFTVGKYGVDALVPLGKLLICFYITCLLTVFVLFGAVMRYTGLSIFRFVAYIKEEIFIVFGTVSSETVLPRMIDKLDALGCARPVVGMVLPAGYAFNMVGTATYLSMATIFLAQATNTPVTIADQLVLLGIMMLTSKGAAAVPGTAFVALTATLASVGHIPVASAALVLGIDRFLAEGRSVTNLIGNGVATIFMAKWEKCLDVKKAQAILAGKKAAALETD